ncbi:hypothetical protein [Pseudarthrobacter sp. NIBRBAC000502770]|nr:hypothetical protein [Pseudarthrobacter sp. NIBRBAC000502770]
MTDRDSLGNVIVPALGALEQGAVEFLTPNIGEVRRHYIRVTTL